MRAWLRATVPEKGLRDALVSDVVTALHMELEFEGWEEAEKKDRTEQGRRREAPDKKLAQARADREARERERESG